MSTIRYQHAIRQICPVRIFRISASAVRHDDTITDLLDAVHLLYVPGQNVTTALSHALLTTSVAHAIGHKIQTVRQDFKLNTMLNVTSQMKQ